MIIIAIATALDNICLASFVFVSNIDGAVLLNIFSLNVNQDREKVQIGH